MRRGSVIWCEKSETTVTDNSHDGLNFDPSNANKIFHYSWKERLKISKMAKFSGEMAVVNDGKYSPVKFANFVDIRITRGKPTICGWNVIVALTCKNPQEV